MIGETSKYHGSYYFSSTYPLCSSRHYAENINALIGITAGLSTKPDAVPSYNIRLLPTTIERSALLYQYEMEEAYGLERAQTAYEEERSRVEDEWKKGRDRVRERLMEGIEERRRRAREDKEGEGTSAGQFTVSSFAKMLIRSQMPQWTLNQDLI